MEKNITKDCLINLGFTEEFSTPEESGEKDGFYYYTYEVAGDCLLISDSNNENDGNFTIEFYEYTTIGITDITDLMQLIAILLKYKLN